MSSADIASQIASLDQSYNPTQQYNQITQQLGIPDARTRVTALQGAIANSESAIKNVDPSVTGRTQNSLVTEAQRQRLVNMEQAPITDQLNSENKDYSTQSTALNDLLGQADKQASLAQSNYSTKRQSLADQLSYAQQQEQAQTATVAAQQKAAGSGSSGGGGTTAAAKPAASYQQRNGGGYNFQNAGGGAISARLYAQLTGTNFNTLLKQMAASGDKGAADVLKNGARSSAYKALTWD